jgi:hypothetical protein
MSQQLKEHHRLNFLGTASVVVVVLALLVLALVVKIVKQDEQGVVFRLGRVLGPREPGVRAIIPFVDVMHRVSMRNVTMPIQSQGIITRDNVGVAVSAVAYFRVVDTVKSVVAIENVRAASRGEGPGGSARRPPSQAILGRVLENTEETSTVHAKPTPPERVRRLCEPKTAEHVRYLTLPANAKPECREGSSCVWTRAPSTPGTRAASWRITCP